MAYGQNFEPKFKKIQCLIKKHYLTKPLYTGDTNSDAIQSTTARVPFVFVAYAYGVTNCYHKKINSFAALTSCYLE